MARREVINRRDGRLRFLIELNIVRRRPHLDGKHFENIGDPRRSPRDVTRAKQKSLVRFRRRVDPVVSSASSKLTFVTTILLTSRQTFVTAATHYANPERRAGLIEVHNNERYRTRHSTRLSHLSRRSRRTTEIIARPLR